MPDPLYRSPDLPIARCIQTEYDDFETLQIIATDSNSDELPPSPTWSDIEYEMIQAEADLYMNSPKAGSE